MSILEHPKTKIHYPLLEACVVSNFTQATMHACKSVAITWHKIELLPLVCIKLLSCYARDDPSSLLFKVITI
jgi:hypothetical protein